MGPDVIGIASVLVAIVSVGGGLAALMLTGHRRLEGRLASEVAAVRGEIGGLRTEFKSEIAGVREEGAQGREHLKKQIAGVRTELREVEQRLSDRIDAVRGELVETRVAMADRVARIEGGVFGVPLPGTGTDSA